MSAEMLWFVQHFLHSLCDFIIGELDVGVSEWVINAAGIFAHQTGALAERQYAP